MSDLVVLTAVITAVATLTTAVGGLIVAFTLLIPMLRTTRSTHTIVNQQRTDMLEFQATLIKTLTAAGIPIPVDQSVARDKK